MCLCLVCVGHQQGMGMFNHGWLPRVGCSGIWAAGLSERLMCFCLVSRAEGVCSRVEDGGRGHGQVSLHATCC